MYSQSHSSQSPVKDEALRTSPLPTADAPATMEKEKSMNHNQKSSEDEEEEEHIDGTPKPTKPQILTMKRKVNDSKT